MQLSNRVSRTDTENTQLVQALAAFNAMYRPHEAREDTVLFPAFRKIVSKNEYDSLEKSLKRMSISNLGKMVLK
jgi:hemerythrin-like domain-containing protein